MGLQLQIAPLRCGMTNKEAKGNNKNNAITKTKADSFPFGSAQGTE